LNDTAAALHDLERARLHLYKLPPAEISFAPYAIYYRLAWMQFHIAHDSITALETLDEGIYWLGKMKNRFSVNRKKFTEEEQNEMLSLFNQLDLDMHELKTLLEH
jgi:hypothetical protein